MKQKGPIIIVEDDQKEQVVYRAIFTETGIKNKVDFFDNGHDALIFLKTTREDPFLIISDIHMPVMDGIEFRRKIVAGSYLKKKEIPFIFRSYSANVKEIREAFELSVQAFFPKTDNKMEMRGQIQCILENCREAPDPIMHGLKLERLSQ